MEFLDNYAHSEDTNDKSSDIDDFVPIEQDDQIHNLFHKLTIHNKRVVFFEKKKCILIGLNCNSSYLNDLYLCDYQKDSSFYNIAFYYLKFKERFIIHKPRNKIDETYECKISKFYSSFTKKRMTVEHFLFRISYTLVPLKIAIGCKSKVARKQKDNLRCFLNVVDEVTIHVEDGSFMYLQKGDYVKAIVNGEIGLYRVSKYTFKSRGKILDANIKLKNLSLRKQHLMSQYRVISFFDYETIDFVLYHQPYMLSSLTFVYSQYNLYESVIEKVYDDKRASSSNFITDMYLTDIFTTYEEDIIRTRQLQLVGFNNNRFDNNFIYEPIHRCPMLSSVFINQSQRNGKTTQTKIICWFKGVRILITIKDMVTWIPDCSLSQACDSYGIKNAKIDFNIVAYNEFCKKHEENNEDKMLVSECDEKTFFSLFKSLNFSIKKQLLNYKNVNGKYRVYDYALLYCTYDTKSLFELFMNINFSVKSIASTIEDMLEGTAKLPTHTFFDYMGAPEFAGYIFRCFFNSDKYKKLTFYDSDHAEIIYSTYFGGRVNYGFIGDYKTDDIMYMDVTSEYPLAMTGYYPTISDLTDYEVGKEINIEEVNNILQQMISARNTYYNEHKLNCYDYMKPLDLFAGIFKCQIIPPEDKTNLICFAAIPTRLPDQLKLEYTNTGGIRFLNSSQFRNLILSGFNIVVLEDIYNIRFNHMTKCFDSFIQALGSIKAAAKYNDNKAKAKLVKTLVNSIAGKLAQKPMHTISVANESSGTTSRITFEETDWTASMHYLACFITANANWILYSKTYELELSYIYNKRPIGERGGICYADTDSIVFSKKLCDKVEFIIDDELGCYEDDKAHWKITWQRHYSGVNRIMIIAKKSYVLLNNNMIKETKLKGIHKKEMGQFNLDILLQVIQNNPKQISFQNLQRKYDLSEVMNGNDSKGMLQRIYVDTVKKTLKREINYKKLLISNEIVIEDNQNALSKKNSFLEFCAASF